jgi:hypothetical protein
VLGGLTRRLQFFEVAVDDAGWRLYALLPEDDFASFGANLARAVAAASALGATGDLVFFGGVTGPGGLGFRLRVGERLEALSADELRDVARDPRAKRLTAIIEETLAREAADRRAKAGPDAYLDGLQHLREPVDAMIGVLRRAEPSAVVEAVAKVDSIFLFASELPSAQAVLDTCLGPHDEYVDPAARTSAILEVAGVLAPEEAQRIAGRLLEQPSLGRHLWRAMLPLLVDTEHAPTALERMCLPNSRELREREAYARPLVRASRLTDPMLTERFRSAVARSPDESYGEDAVATVVASALIDRGARGAFDDIATARFESASPYLRSHLAELVLEKGLPIPRRPLASMMDDTLRFELARRMLADPSTAFDDIEEALSRRHADVTHAALVALVRALKPEGARRVLSEEPRWVAWLRSLEGDPSGGSVRAHLVQEALGRIMSREP